MFVVLGCVTVVIGAATGWWLPDTPMQARFLREGEKVALLKYVAVNRTGIRNPGFKARQVLEIVLDVQLWLMTVLTILVCNDHLPAYLMTSLQLRRSPYQAE